MLKIKFFERIVLKNPQNLRNLLRLESTSTQVQSKLGEDENNKIKSQTNATSNSNDLSSKKPVTFAKLFKESKFVAMGNLQNKIFVGRIVDVNGDDLYIDYGGKFNCVCKKPLVNTNLYVRNANVRIKLKSFEMASYFLNSAKHITLLESDADLLGLFNYKVDENDKPRDISLQKETKELNLEPKHY